MYSSLTTTCQRRIISECLQHRVSHVLWLHSQHESLSVFIKQAVSVFVVLTDWNIKGFIFSPMPEDFPPKPALSQNLSRTKHLQEKLDFFFSFCYKCYFLVKKKSTQNTEVKGVSGWVSGRRSPAAASCSADSSVTYVCVLTLSCSVSAKKPVPTPQSPAVCARRLLSSRPWFISSWCRAAIPKFSLDFLYKSYKSFLFDKFLIYPR